MALSQDFTLFGPKTMQNCTLFVRLEGDEGDLTELPFLIYVLHTLVLRAFLIEELYFNQTEIPPRGNVI